MALYGGTTYQLDKKGEFETAVAQVGQMRAQEAAQAKRKSEG